jgi:hypothetical protein
MAQYHFAATLVCRSKGQSAVAAAAYRAGVSLEDERLGKTFDYTRRRGVLHTEIRTPDQTPDWMRDRGQLFNAIEKAEKRKDSQLVRSIDIALPCELTLQHNVELVRNFVDAQYVSRGMIADFAIHAPGRKGDIRNVHVHILLTTREIAGPGFGPKVREWNGKNELLEWRKAWADHANRILEREGFEERIDHRSLSDQGIDREPTSHVGPTGKEMEERGDVSDRAQKNRDIKATNDNIELLKKELAESDKRLAELKQQLVAERTEQIQQTVRAVDAAYDKAEQGGRQAPVPERPPKPEPPALAKQPEPRAPAPRRPRPSAAERIQQAQKIVQAVDAAYEKTKQRQDTAQPLQPQAPPPYPEHSPPVSVGGKAVPMPDDLSEAQKLEAERQTEEQKTEQARQDKAAEAEQARQKQAADEQEKNLEARKQENIRQLNKRIDDLAKEQEALLVAQAEEMRQVQLRRDAEREQKARIDAYRVEQEKISADDRRKEESERQAKLEAQSKEGPIRDAGERYAQALGQHYDLANPYASLAKVAMEEHAAFRKDREALDQQIAKTADPHERQALDLRKRIEGAEYILMTSERIAQQSVVITGRRDSDEAVKFRKRAIDHRIQAQDLRQQLRQHQRGPAPEKDAGRERTARPQPTAGRPRNRAAGEYDPIKKVDDTQQPRRRDPDRER